MEKVFFFFLDNSLTWVPLFQKKTVIKYVIM